MGFSYTVVVHATCEYNVNNKKWKLYSVVRGQLSPTSPPGTFTIVNKHIKKYV